ncbi:hypothetical protein EWM64_g2799 [Hericium alpestre]|uniref:Uncharacterized protein n=1 Tax=Hericium alpestre TaxID=135208 RepID=A0A4Z0A6C1_9AGAM|nr:hypothetical protein EWM64_g2799 [Hericium alpestre]
MIFKDSEEVSDEGSGEINENVERQGGQEQTTLITWAQTQNESGMQSGAVADTFFRASPSRVQSLIETQETQGGTSYNYSDASSIARFPDFHFNLHSLVDFSSLKLFQGSRKVCILLAVLETEGPDTIRLKKGLEAGKEIYVFNMIVGNEDGVVCKLTAWREVAETWGGVGPATGIKRGDVVFFESTDLRAPISGHSDRVSEPEIKGRDLLSHYASSGDSGGWSSAARLATWI